MVSALLVPTDPSAVNVRTNDLIPGTLFYKFIPINIDIAPTAKTELFVDTEQDSKLIVLSTVYIKFTSIQLVSEQLPSNLI